ncbi:Protein of unknown function, partial [Gryllus bimaculatus]
SDEEEALHASDTAFEEVIDPILREADLNNDGFIDYLEYKKHGERNL